MKPGDVVPVRGVLSRRPLPADLHGHPVEGDRVHNSYTNGSLAARLDRAGRRPAAPGCHYVGCSRPGTHDRHGLRLCLGHFFQVIRWEDAA